MGEHWWRRRKRFDLWFGDIFEKTDKIEKTMDEMIRQTFGSPAEKAKARRHYVHQFGNPNSIHSGSSQVGKFDPLVDVFSEKTSIAIVAELPGVARDQIEIHVSQGKVEISAGSPKWKYHKELKLPAKVDPKSSVASCKNGVLEIRLRKLRKPFLR